MDRNENPNSHERWSREAANEWYAKQPCLIGANYVPASAINQLEMWQKESFDPARINLELGWAEDIGMNTMRVFLHDLVWDKDPEGFRDRIDEFLNICDRHGIKPMLVLFDSVWDPDPKAGPQRVPTPGVHNSGWVQSPGAKALADPAQYKRLEAYVKGVIHAFADDPRVLAWDLWNEPDNGNDASYGLKGLELVNKHELVLNLLPQVFQWAREARPSQPLTSGVWRGDWADNADLDPIFRVQLEMSDIISFHNYDPPAEFERRVDELSQHGRPMLCTEYMARSTGNTFEDILPIARRFNVAAYNWGFVAGKSQTNLPWDSWQNPYVNGRELPLWFHDIFHEDGTPYREAEIKIIAQTPS